MPKFLRPALCLTLLGLAACDEIAVADDPAALAELRGQKSCVSAVAQQTGAAGFRSIPPARWLSFTAIS